MNQWEEVQQWEANWHLREKQQQLMLLLCECVSVLMRTLSEGCWADETDKVKGQGVGNPLILFVFGDPLRQKYGVNCNELRCLHVSTQVGLFRSSLTTSAGHLELSS